MQHTISVLVSNRFGVLSRISGLFSGRGFNIESLNVAATNDPNISRMTIVTIGDEKKIEQITKQLNKLIDIIAGAQDEAVERLKTCAMDHLVMGMSAETFWDGAAGAAKLQTHMEKISGTKVTMGSDACQAALKSRRTMGEAEARSLVEALAGCRSPLVCPHGRPVAVPIDVAEIERRFGRR